MLVEVGLTKLIIILFIYIFIYLFHEIKKLEISFEIKIELPSKRFNNSH